MNNFLFYAATILIWGSTWLAIKFQLGSIDPAVSIAYRFSAAAVLLLAYCKLFGLRMRFSSKDHLFIALQGALLFALNYWLFYLAEMHLASGLVAVVFSTMVVMNVLNGALFLGTPVEPKVLLGAGLGLTGIALIFLPELASFDASGGGIRGLLLCFGASYLASLGNIVSARNQKNSLPVLQANAYGMTYGALLMLAVALIGGKEFALDLSFAYLGSLFYLSIFGSIIAFGCYLSLVGKIGADRAAYTTLLFPVVALGISTIYEGYRWTAPALAGIALIIAGNALVLTKKRRVEAIARA